MLPCCIECGFIHQVGQISSRKPRSTTGQYGKININSHRYVFGVDSENTKAPTHVRRRDYPLTVKSRGTQQSRVEDIGTIRSCNQNAAIISLKAVHLNQELI